MKAAVLHLAVPALAAAAVTITSAAQALSVTHVTARAVAERQSVMVSLEGLDINSPQGRQTLHYRLSRAAEEVCGSRDPRVAGGVAQAARNVDCHLDALSRALAAVSADTVASRR